MSFKLKKYYLYFIESRSFQIEVLTSGREEITVVRLSPKAVLQKVEETFRKNIKVCICIVQIFDRLIYYTLALTKNISLIISYHKTTGYISTFRVDLNQGGQ